MDPTLIFFLLQFSSLISFMIVATGKVMVDLGEGWSAIAVAISEHTVELFLCEK